ncbi:MAG: hypothetical protein DCC71_22055 [Proteobacteria bacterium]|nr:MAG: hypothetical protein DCC71_22055 [Pseudomonadota bacterium]
MLRMLLLAALAFAPSLAHAEARGVDSRQEFPPLGCGSSATGEESGCHVQDANPELMVTITPPEEPLVPGGAGLYTASIPAGFGGLQGAGINVVIDGPNTPACELEEFAPVGKLGKLNDTLDPTDYVLSHLGDNEPPANLVGVWSYQFLVLNCQVPGTLLLRVAMNAFDGSGDEIGEAWNAGAGALAALLALGATARRRRR